MSSVLSGRLRSGKLWALIESQGKSLSEEKGSHMIVQCPRDENEPDGDAYRRDELTGEDTVELFGVADSHAQELSESLGRPGYYRVECNGPAAATRNHLHFHVIAGREGVTFRRCVDSIERQK